MALVFELVKVMLSVLVPESAMVLGLKLFATVGAAIRVKVTDTVVVRVILSVVSTAV